SAIVALLHRRKLGLEVGDELGAMFTLTRLLGRVVTDDVTLPTLPVADEDLLDAQVVLDLLVASRASEDVVSHLVSRAHARREDVLAVAERQRTAVVRGVHARVADEDTPAESPPPKVLLHLLDRRHVARLARQDPRAHGEPVARDREADDDLRRITPAVLRVASLAKRLVLPLEL